MISYGAFAGTDVHPLVADRAEDWFAGEPVFFLPGCKITPQEAHLLLFWVFSSSACSVPVPQLSEAQQTFFPSLVNFAMCFHHSVWQCFHIREHLTLPCHFFETRQASSLTFIPSFFLPSLSDSRLFFHLEKKSQTLRDPKLGMSLTWLSCLLVKLQWFLC